MYASGNVYCEVKCANKWLVFIWFGENHPYILPSDRGRFFEISKHGVRQATDYPTPKHSAFWKARNLEVPVDELCATCTMHMHRCAIMFLLAAQV